MQFTRPVLLIRDVDLIRQITTTDFDHFHDHYKPQNDPLLSKILINLSGHQWRQMRATLSPVFTTSSMKIMYPLMTECAHDFVGHFRGKEQVAVDMKDIFSRFSVDVIASTAFGTKIDSLDEPKNDFFKMGSRLDQGLYKYVLSKLPFLAEVINYNVRASTIYKL